MSQADAVVALAVQHQMSQADAVDFLADSQRMLSASNVDFVADSQRMLPGHGHASPVHAMTRQLDATAIHPRPRLLHAQAS